MNSIADHAVVIHRCGGIDDDEIPKPGFRADGGHGEQLTTLADVRVRGDECSPVYDRMGTQPARFHYFGELETIASARATYGDGKQEFRRSFASAEPGVQPRLAGQNRHAWNG